MPDDKIRVSRTKTGPVKSVWKKNVGTASHPSWQIIADAPTNRLIKVRIEWKKDGVKQKLVLGWDDKYVVTFVSS